MKYFVFLLAVVLISNSLLAQDLNWVKDFNASTSTSWSYGYSITIDSLENVYTVGSFTGTVDFDPSAGTFFLSTTAVRCPFITKFDSAGNFIWAKAFNTSLWAGAFSVSTDPLGNIFISGQFQSATDFDPGPSSFILSPNALSDHYICKLDAAGNFVWVRNFQNASWFTFMDIVSDGVGGVYAASAFTLSVDVDPGPSITSFTTASNLDYDSYVLRLNSAGSLQWANHVGSPSGTGDEITAIDRDFNGALHVVGRFSGTIDFDPGPLSYTLSSVALNSFLLKLNSNGNFVKALLIGSPNFSQGGINIKYLDVNRTGIYYAGNGLGGACDFDPGPSTYTLGSPGYSGNFVSRLDTAYNFVYAKDYGNLASIYSISADTLANAYFTGYFSNSYDFDSGVGVYSLTSTGGNDIFVCKLDHSGTFGWAVGAGGITNDYGTKLVSSKTGNTYITGHFTSSSVDFKPGIGTYTLSTSLADGYVWKLGPCSSGSAPVNTSPASSGCTGLSMVLTASTSGNYINWYSSATSNISLSSGGIFITPVFTSPGTYTYYVESVGCSVQNQRSAFLFTVNASPSVSLSASSSTVCAGTQATLTASGAQNYVWSVPGSGNTLLVSPTLTTIYSVTGYQNSCPDSKSFTVSVLSPPALSILSSGSTSLCAGGGATLTATGAATYSWNNGSTTSSIVTSQLSSGAVFVLSGTNSAGCFATVSSTVSPTPAMTINSSHTLLCEGETATLSVSGANTYTWTNLLFGATIQVSPLNSTTYSVTGTNSSGCSAVSSITLSVSNCLGLTNSLKGDPFRLFPNPTSGNMSLETSLPFKIEIHTVSGELVYSSAQPGGNSMLNLGDLPQGVYFFTLISDAQSYRRKVIKT